MKYIILFIIVLLFSCNNNGSTKCDGVLYGGSMKWFFVLIILISFLGCEKFDATNISCDEKNKCPDLHYCESNHCVKSECLSEIKGKNGVDCVNPQKCNIFTGNCEEIIVCETNGIIDEQDCGFNNNGKQSVVCKDGRWENVGLCNQTDICTDDEIILSEELCGINKSGKKNKLCENGVLVDTDLCKETDINCVLGCNDDDVCINTTQRDDILPCGINSAGLQKEICSDGQWISDSTCEIEEENCESGCIDNDVCINNNYRDNIKQCGINSAGLQKEICTNGKWIDNTICGTEEHCELGCIDDDICVNTSTDEINCGLNNRGKQQRVCYSGLWVNFGSCADDDVCVDNEVTNAACSFESINTSYEQKCYEGVLLCSVFIKQHGSANDDRGFAIAVDNHENIFITGETKGNLDGIINNGDYDIFLIKYDKYGNKLWTKLYGTISYDSPRAIAVDSSGNVYITGETRGSLDGRVNKGESDIFLTKFDNDGNKLWTELYGTTSFDSGLSIVIDNNDNIYISSITNGTIGESTQPRDECDIALLKLNNNGVLIKSTSLASNSYDYGYGITIKDDSVYITGVTRGEFLNNENTNINPLCNFKNDRDDCMDTFVAKYNTTSDSFLWVKQFGTNDKDIAYAVTVDRFDNIYLTGFTDGAFNGYSNPINYDIFLAKYDTLGEQIWVKQSGSSGYNDVGKSIKVDSEDNIFITGYTYSNLNGETNNGNADVFLTKYNSNGTVLFTKLFGSTLIEEGLSIAIDSNNKIYITGFTYGSMYGNQNSGITDMFLIKWEE